MSENPTLAGIRHLIIDIDGVLWHGKQVLPGVPGLFAFMQAHGIRYIIATNNSARPGSEIVDRLARIGVRIADGDVLTSAQATAMYLPRVAPRGARVLVVGGQGLLDAITQAGYQIVDEDAAVVVAGVDFGLTYDRLKRATREIRHGATFVGTNGDKTYPGDDGLAPGAGAVLAAIQAATDVDPIVIGKPQRAMFDLAVEKMGAERASTAMLGDRLDTDIQGAQRAGLRSILVMTGVTSPSELAASSVRPDWVFDDVVALEQAWQAELRPIDFT